MNGPRDPDAFTSPETEHAHPGLDHLDLPFGDLAPAAHARIGRHSSFVSIMKIALPLGALVLLGIVLFYSGVFDSRDRLDITFREIATLNNDLRMVSPRITGLDKSGQPYLLTADTATQGAAGTTRRSMSMCPTAMSFMARKARSISATAISSATRLSKATGLRARCALTK